MRYHFKFPAGVRDNSERELPVSPEFRADADGRRYLIDTGPSRAGGHQMETFEVCPRMYRILEEMRRDGRIPNESRFFLNRGSLVHIGCAHYHAIRAIREQGKVRAGDVVLTDESQLYPAIESVHVGADIHVEWRGSLRESVEIVNRYIEWAEVNPNPWTILGIEVEVGILLAPGEVYTARLDLLVKNTISGLIYAVDHKTSYNPAIVPKQYGHSWQIIGVQTIGKELYGPKWGGVILNAIASNAKGKNPVFRAPPAPAPALEAKFRDHAIAQRAALRRTQARPVSEAEMHLSSCQRPRDGVCPVYSQCAVTT